MLFTPPLPKMNKPNKTPPGFFQLFRLGPAVSENPTNTAVYLSSSVDSLTTLHQKPKNPRRGKGLDSVKTNES